MYLQPFDKHPASPAALRESAAELRQRAAEVLELAGVTRQAYQPAIANWDGMGAAEMAAAAEPLQQSAQQEHRDLLWAATVGDYWAGRVEGFNAQVDVIVAGLGGLAGIDFGATGTGGKPPTGAQIADARGAATAAAKQQWMQAHAEFIEDGRQEGASMLRQGPTEHHLLTLRQAGELPGQQAAGPPRGEPAEDDGDAGWFSSVGHGVLDVVGLVPVVGEPADAANAVWYLAEGDRTNAALSAAAMVPIAGWAATGGKFGVKGVRMVRGGNGARAWLKGRPSMVPRNAEKVPFKPSQKFPVGESYRWTDPASGKTVRYHAHGADPTRPVTENAGQGPIYRQQVGSNHYLDADGNLHTKNSLNPNSPAYDPKAANDTHIPYPKGQPPPDQHHVRVAAPNPAGLAGPDGDEK